MAAWQVIRLTVDERANAEKAFRDAIEGQAAVTQPVKKEDMDERRRKTKMKIDRDRLGRLQASRTTVGDGTLVQGRLPNHPQV